MDSYADIPPVLDVIQAAEVLGIAERTMRARIEDGSIHYVRLGRLIRIPRHAIVDFLASSTTTGPSHTE